MIERSDLIVFDAAARHLNFSTAAKELKMTAPQVSKIISKMEGLTKKTLFVRNTRQMRLSEHGMALVPAARQALGAFLDVDQLFAADENDGAVSGILRINCAHTLGVKVIARIVASFQADYPDVQVQVLLSDHYEDLVEQNIDMSIRIFKLENSALICRKLGDNPLTICAPPEYLKGIAPILTVADLSKHKILYIPTHANAKFVKSGLTLGDLCPVAWTSASNGDFLTELAKHGSSLIVRSRWSINREIEEGSLVPLKLDDHLVSDTSIYAVYHPNKFIPKRLRLWLDHLAAEFPKG